MMDDNDAVSVDAMINGDRPKVLAALDRAPSTMAAIHRTSHHVHRDMAPWKRRQILALDAARFGDRALSSQIIATPVPDEPDAEWTVDWATGALVEPRLRVTIDTGPHSVGAVAPVVIGGRPHVVSGGDCEDGGRGTARLWDAVTGEPVGEPMECGDETWVRAVTTLEIDGRPHAITAGTDENLRVWDLTTCRQVRTYTARFNWIDSLATVTAGGHAYAVASYSDDGSTDGMVEGWDLTTGSALYCPDDEGLAALAAVVIDGRAHAVAGFRDGSVWVWDMATGNPADPSPRGHDAAVNTVTTVVLGERPHAVTTATDGTVFLWDLTTGERVGAPLVSRPEPVLDVSIVEIDGRTHAVVLDRDGMLAVLDFDSRDEVIEKLSVGYAGCVSGTVVDGRPHAITGHPDGTVRVWELRPLPPECRPVPGHRKMVDAVLTAELDGRPHVVSGDSGGVVRTWDLATGAPGIVLETGGLGAEIAHSTIGFGGREHLVTGRGRGAEAGMWDLITGKPAGEPFTVGNGLGPAATVMIDGRPHAVFCTDDGLPVWDLTTRERVGTPMDGDEYWDIAAPVEIDGRPHLVVAALGGTLYLWDLITGRPVGQPLTGHDQSVYAIATTAVDGRPHAVTAGPDRTVRVWDLTAGAQAGAPITAHEWGANAVAVGDIGGRRLIVTGGDDHTVRFWDLATREQVGRDLHFTWKVFGVAISSDGQIVVGFGHEVVALSRTAAFTPDRFTRL
ncbi:WD40 repeat domain-containing protein [Spirillospora sp. CA-128828]|uniref:WD40 repeat domain-containing protein n=1 Tax=Spirillospora sp. CA-128828 TaxID=3240033 RepID=UPI003D9343E0